MREVLPPAPPPDAAALEAAEKALKPHAIKGVRKLVLVDGVFVPELSDLDNLEAGLASVPCARCWKAATRALLAQMQLPTSRSPMIALNAAMMTDGVVIEVADGAALAQPLHIVHIASAQRRRRCSPVRCCASARRASATLVESFIAAEGAGAYQVHDALIVVVGDGARLDHVRLVEDGRDAFNISSAIVTLGAQSAFQHIRHDQRRRRQPLSGLRRVCRRGRARRDQRRQSAQRPPARRHHAVPRPCGAELHQPRNLPRRGRRPRAIRCSRAASSSAPTRRRPTPR